MSRYAGPRRFSRPYPTAEELERAIDEIAETFDANALGSAPLWKFERTVLRTSGPVGLGRAVFVDPSIRAVTVSLPPPDVKRSGLSCMVVRIRAGTINVKPTGRDSAGNAIELDGSASAQSVPSTIGAYVYLWTGLNWRAVSPSQDGLPSGGNENDYLAIIGGIPTWTPPSWLAGVVQLHDTTHSPVALWQLQGDLTDSSGNGFTHSVDAGTLRYSELYPGIGAVISEGGLRLRAAYDPLLTITGALTVEALISPATVSEPSVDLVTCGRNTTGRTQYQISLNNSSNNLEYRHGVDIALPDETFGPARWYPNRLCHFALTRSSGMQMQFYLDGKPFGPLSSVRAAVNSPDVNAGNALWLGSNTRSLMHGMVASVKIIASELSAAQILAEYNRTLGGLYGVRV